MTPRSSTATPPAPGSISPKPVPTRPGSMPSTRRLGGRDGLENLVGNVVVSVDGLDVVQLLQRLDQAHHGGGVLALDPHRRLRHEVYLALEHGHARPAQRLEDRVHFSRRRDDLESFFGPSHVGGTGVERLPEQVVLADLAGVDLDDPLALEHPRDGARGSHVAPYFSNTCRISGPVRWRLSVSTWIRTATPPGAYPS